MKLLQQSLRVTFGALLVLVLATACSGGGGHHDSADGSTPPGGDTGTDGGSAKSCVQQFNPDLAAAGDDCTPSYNQYCPDATSPTLFNDSTVGSCDDVVVTQGTVTRSEEHTSELQSLMRISYAVFCLKKKNNIKRQTYTSVHSVR